MHDRQGLHPGIVGPGETPYHSGFTDPEAPVMNLRSIVRLVPTSMGGILNAICMVYFFQRGGNWIFLGVAHGVMVIVLGYIAAQKAKARDAREAGDAVAPGEQQH